MNKFYKDRYDKFIKSIRDRGQREFAGYSEVHHIVPRCLKGSDEDENLIRLTLREHFLAHWLLWRAYPKSLGLASAFLQMNNKNPALESIKGFQGRINSKTYEMLKIAVYEKLSKVNKNKVRLKDKDGNPVTLTRDEYKKQKDLSFHTAGKVAAYDKKSDQMVYVDTEEYHGNPYLVFHTAGKIYVFDKEINDYVYIDTSTYHENKSRYITRLSDKSPAASKYTFINAEDGSIVHMTKFHARELNQQFGYKKFKQVIDHKLKCVDTDGKVVQVSTAEYHSRDDLAHVNQDRFPVLDLSDGVRKSITRDEYHLNKDRYVTSTKGKILARDMQGNPALVTREQFDQGGYVGQTLGLRTVFDRDLGAYVQITQDEFKQNRDRYVGPNQGKVNVIDKTTGQRKQIAKDQFDSTRYCYLGDVKFLFRCKNKLTGQEKNVSIYEWDLVKDQYDIIETEKFKKALKEK